MLNRGRYCLMKLCSASSASASVATTTHTNCSTAASISAWPGLLGTCALAKCDATRLRTDLALPTYSTRPRPSRNRYTPGWSGSARRCSAMSARARSASVSWSVAAIAPRIGARRTPSVGAGVAVDLQQRPRREAEQYEPAELAETGLPHARARGPQEHAEREADIQE